MKILTMDSTIKNGKNNEMKVSDLVNVKGKIFSLIKDGYYFDDEVLKAAHITKTICDENVFFRVSDVIQSDDVKLPKDTASTKQIISELNTITKTRDKENDEDFSSYNNQIDNMSFDNMDKEND